MDENSHRQSIDMLRAKDAWNRVSEVKRGGADRGKYGSRAKDIGALIMTAGLGAALAFLRSKDEAARLLYRHISDWATPRVEFAKGSGNDLLPRLMENDTTDYRRATSETLAYVLWLKRFVEGEFKEDIDKAQQQGDDNG